MNQCKVCTNPVLDTKSRRLLASETLTHIKQCLVNLVCQASNINADEASALFSEGYVCRGCMLSVSKYINLSDSLDIKSKELIDVLSKSYTSQEYPTESTARGTK